MKPDRVYVFLFATVCVVVANLLPTAFPQECYGRGLPLKWTYDPAHKYQGLDDPEDPYTRKSSPSEKWKFDGAALAVDVAVGLAVVGVVLWLNELTQIALGNRLRRR
jgi:hypothetical protein